MTVGVSGVRHSLLAAAASAGAPSRGGLPRSEFKSLACKDRAVGLECSTAVCRRSLGQSPAGFAAFSRGRDRRLALRRCGRVLRVQSKPGARAWRARLRAAGRVGE